MTKLPSFRSTLIEVPDGSGDCFVSIPDKMMKRLGWAIGDAVEVQPQPGGRLLITRCSGSETTIDTEVLARAREAFDTPEQADGWLNKHHRILGMSPIEYLNAGKSKKDILKILNAILHGGPV